MKKETFVLFSIVGLIFVGILTAFSSGKLKSPPDKESGESFAVIELFTSEGCSSCPPADKLLGNIIKQARKDHSNVYALAFHVDYWNYLGWKDIYSKSAYSARQRHYASLLNSSVYTPQMVINGRQQFVGSNRSKAYQYIEQALKDKEEITLSLKANLSKVKRSVMVNYRLSERPSSADLHIALAERGLARKIENGENQGRTLHHENIVRSFKTLKPDRKSGQSELKIPENVDLSRSSVIAFVQDNQSGEIVAAQEQDL